MIDWEHLLWRFKRWWCDAMSLHQWKMQGWQVVGMTVVTTYKCERCGAIDIDKETFDVDE